MSIQPLPGLSQDEMRRLVEEKRRSANAGAFAALVGDAATEVFTSRTIVNPSELVGVPFVVTHVKFTAGDYQRDFVSCELTTFDDRELVMNDGSTGIRRQVVTKLAADGVINVGTRTDLLSEADHQLEDLSAKFWDAGGDVATDDGFSVKWLFANGTRLSEYDSPAGGKATTAYFG